VHFFLEDVLYHTYLSAFFVSPGVPNGEFPEIFIPKCRSRFYCTSFFSRAEDFESCSMPTGFFIWGYMYPFTFIFGDTSKFLGVQCIL
jgi:hypothetical protein